MNTEHMTALAVKKGAVCFEKDGNYGNYVAGSVLFTKDQWEDFVRALGEMHHQKSYMRGLRENTALIFSQTALLKKCENAMHAMLTQFGMDEDEFSKPTFDQVREALREMHARSLAKEAP